MACLDGVSITVKHLIHCQYCQGRKLILARAHFALNVVVMVYESSADNPGFVLISDDFNLVRCLSLGLTATTTVNKMQYADKLLHK